MSNKLGRKTIMTQETIDKLEEAFSNGATDKEACFIAGISHQTLYTYQENNPEFIDRKEALKDMIKYQAKKNIRDAIFGGNLNQSTWYAERKIKEEFAQRTEMTGADGKDLIPDPETIAKTEEAISKYLNK